MFLASLFCSPAAKDYAINPVSLETGSRTLGLSSLNLYFGTCVGPCFPFHEEAIRETCFMLGHTAPLRDRLPAWLLAASLGVSSLGWAVPQLARGDVVDSPALNARLDLRTISGLFQSAFLRFHDKPCYWKALVYVMDDLE